MPRIFSLTLVFDLLQLFPNTIMNKGISTGAARLDFSLIDAIYTLLGMDQQGLLPVKAFKKGINVAIFSLDMQNCHSDMYLSMLAHLRMARLLLSSDSNLILKASVLLS
jgi:hypothetical protein